MGAGRDIQELRRSCVYLASVYGSSRDIREFGGHVGRPVVDGAGNLRPDRRGGQSALLPGISRTMPAGVGRGLGRLWGVSVDDGHGRVARRIKDDDDGGIRAGRLCAGDGTVCRGGSDLGARETSIDRVGGGLVGAHGLRHNAPVLFSGVENPRAGGGGSLPADGGRLSRRTVALPVRAYWAGAFPLRRWAGDVEPALAAIHQSHSR